MSSVNSWTDAVILAIAEGLQAFVSFVPNLLGAIIVFLVGWIIAGMLKKFTLRVLKVLQLEPFAEKVGVVSALKKVGATVSPPELIGELVKWFVVLLFLSPAVEILGLREVTTIINSVLLYIPNVLVAVIIVMVGVIFSDLISQLVHGTASALGTSTSSILAVITKYSISTFAFLAALTQLGIAQQLIATLFTGLVAMLAIAGGLAFGLGGKDTAAEILEDLRKNLKEKK